MITSQQNNWRLSCKVRILGVVDCTYGTIDYPRYHFYFVQTHDQMSVMFTSKKRSVEILVEDSMVDALKKIDITFFVGLIARQRADAR